MGLFLKKGSTTHFKEAFSLLPELNRDNKNDRRSAIKYIEFFSRKSKILTQNSVFFKNRKKMNMERRKGK